MAVDAFQEDLRFLKSLESELRRFRATEPRAEVAAPRELVGALANWLDAPQRGDVSTMTLLVTGPDRDSEGRQTTSSVDWRAESLGSAANSLAQSLGVAPSSRRLTDSFRALETVVLVNSGYSYSDAVTISRSLSTFPAARTWARSSTFGTFGFGFGLSAFADSLRNRAQAGLMSLREFAELLRDSKSLVYLGAAIDADGSALGGLDAMVGPTIALAVCVCSQHLAEIRALIQAARGR